MSDDDLIRRGDALYAIAGWEIPSTAIAALPARGVGVKPLQWKQAGGNIKAGEGFSAWPDLIHAPLTIYRKRDGWWLSSDCKTHPTLDAAKAAAQADYEARILAALEPAPTDAAQAPAEDAHVKGETAGQMLERLGMDGVKWAAEFRTTALRLGYSDMDEGWLIGWFCNAIMAGYDRSAAQARVIRNGEHLFNTAKSLGWADDGEGALEFVMRRTREVALEDAAAVAMKAREAALREAAALADEHTFGGPAVRDAILALIGEGRG